MILVDSLRVSNSTFIDHSGTTHVASTGLYTGLRASLRLKSLCASCTLDVFGFKDRPSNESLRFVSTYIRQRRLRLIRRFLHDEHTEPRSGLDHVTVLRIKLDVFDETMGLSSENSVNLKTPEEIVKLSQFLRGLGAHIG